MNHRTHTPYLSFLLFIFFLESSLAQVSFQRLTTRSYFVDKTGLIDEFFKTNDSYLMICANRKYGKSVNLDMLKQFVQIEVNTTTGIPLNKTESSGYSLFTNTSLNLNITQNKDLIQEHLGEYPTIFLDFASRKVLNFSSATFEFMLDLIRTDISESFKSYEWLYEKLLEKHGDEKNTTKEAQIQLMKGAINKTLSVEQMRTSIYNLSEILTEYFDNKTVMVFVDEIVKLPDDITNVQKSKSLLAVNDLIGNILNNLMKSYSNDTHLARVFITGNSKAPFDSYRNPFLRKNVRGYPFLKGGHVFNGFYGFNETEVNNLCDRLNITEAQKNGLNKVYMGESYQKGKTHIKVYNPFLVMKYFKNIIKPAKPENKTRSYYVTVNPEIERWSGNDISF